MDQKLEILHSIHGCNPRQPWAICSRRKNDIFFFNFDCFCDNAIDKIISMYIFFVSFHLKNSMYQWCYAKSNVNDNIIQPNLFLPNIATCLAMIQDIMIIFNCCICILSNGGNSWIAFIPHVCQNYKLQCNGNK